MYSIIKDKIKEQKAFITLCHQLKENKHAVSLFGVSDSIKPLFSACLNDIFDLPVIFVCKNAKDAKRYHTLAYVENSAYFPPKDMEFQRFDAKSREDENLRVGTLKGLIKNNLSVVFKNPV